MSAELWAVVGAWGILFVRVGLAFQQAGTMRAKNASSALVRCIVELAVATLAFWAIGMAIASPRQMVQWKLFLNPPVTGFTLRLLVGALLCTGIAVGALAERARFGLTIWVSAVLAALLYPMAVRAAGWLMVHDAAGASFIHVAAGAVALMGALFVGPRTGKYNRDGSANAIPGHSLPMTSVGILILLGAWPVYVAGFADSQVAALTAINVLLSGAAGAVAGMAFSQFRYGKPDVHLIYAGLIGGLVAISASADVAPGWAAVLIGAIAGLIVPLATLAMDLLWHVDDPTNAVASHGVAGAWGIVAGIPIFTATGSGGDIAWKAIAMQLAGLALIAAIAAIGSATLFATLRAMRPLRVKEADEYDGLDLAEHDVGAYPDFQQNTIKSYHLREA